MATARALCAPCVSPQDLRKHAADKVAALEAETSKLQESLSRAEAQCASLQQQLLASHWQQVGTHRQRELEAEAAAAAQSQVLRQVRRPFGLG
jgi:hypothetical protein